MARFNSDSAETAGKVERVVSQVGRQIKTVPAMECATAKSDPLCSWGSAYVPADGSKVVFCAKFFENGADPATIVHEMAHATTGGAHIIDRGYQGERILPLLPKISTDEALNNAESYSEFVSDIVSGHAVDNAVPDDKVECPDDLKDPLKSLRRQGSAMDDECSQRLSRQGFQIGRPNCGGFCRLWIPASTTDIAHITDVFKKANAAFYQPVHLVCQDAKNAGCGQGPPVQFTAGDSTLYLCPAWRARHSMPTIGSCIASCSKRFMECWEGRRMRRGEPGSRTLRKLSQTTNSSLQIIRPLSVTPGWTPDMLSIYLKQEQPLIAGTQEFYRESKTTHDRLSGNLPQYAGPNCMQSTLPLGFSVYFTVDQAGSSETGSIPPPSVSVHYWFTGAARPDPALDYFEEDTNARYGGENTRLADKLKDPYTLNFTQNGIFHMNFRMEDPDSKTVLVYTDQIPVEPVRQCNPAQPAQIANPSQAVGRNRGRAFRISRSRSRQRPLGPTTIARHASGEANYDAIPQSVQGTLETSGQPLESGTRTFMESRFGQDFSQVRVHADTQADGSARDIGARGIHGRKSHRVSIERIHAPATNSGRHLIAHGWRTSYKTTGANWTEARRSAGLAMQARLPRTGPLQPSFRANRPRWQPGRTRPSRGR